MNDELVPYRQGMDYGVGIDTPSGDARNAGVVFETTEIEGAGGSIVTFSLSRIETDEDLQESLGLSASASGGIGLFSASASMNFAKACHVHNNSVFLLASVEVSRAYRQIRKPRLDDDAKRVLAEEGADSTRFREMYGDVFVRGIQTGGRFFACVEVITSGRSSRGNSSGSKRPEGASASIRCASIRSTHSKCRHVELTPKSGPKDLRGTRLVVQSLCGLGLVGRGPL